MKKFAIGGWKLGCITMSAEGSCKVLFQASTGIRKIYGEFRKGCNYNIVLFLLLTMSSSVSSLPSFFLQGHPTVGLFCMASGKIGTSRDRVFKSFSFISLALYLCILEKLKSKNV